MTDTNTAPATAETLEAEGRAITDWLECQFVTMGKEFMARMTPYAARVEGADLSVDLKVALIHMLTGRLGACSARFAEALDADPA